MLKIIKKLRAASFNSEFTGSYEKVYPYRDTTHTTLTFVSPPRICRYFFQIKMLRLAIFDKPVNNVLSSYRSAGVKKSFGSYWPR